MAALTLTLSASAQRLLDVRGEAQYITDKMALELDLTPSQRNSILQLNLTYLDGITSYRDHRMEISQQAHEGAAHPCPVEAL